MDNEALNGPLRLTTGTPIRELIRQMAEAQFDLVACDLPDNTGVLMVAIMPSGLAERVRPILQRQFDDFYSRG